MLVVSPRNFTRPSLVVFLIATFIQKFSYSELKLFPLRKFEKVQLKEAWLYRKFNRKFSSDQMENHCFFLHSRHKFSDPQKLATITKLK